MDLKDIRLKNMLTLIKQYGTAKSFSKVTGISASQISHIKNKEHVRHIGDNAARKIETVTGKPKYWLDQNHETSSINEPNARYYADIDSWDSSTPLNMDDIEVPYFMDIELAAGSGSEATEEYRGYKLRLSKSTLRKAGVDPSAAVCAKVFGNSMEPRLYDGDVVGINTTETQIADGNVYAINHNGMLRIKTLYLTPQGGVRVSSFNKEEHPDEMYDQSQRNEIRVIGRVFWHSSIW